MSEKSETIYNGKLLKLKKQGLHELIEHPGACAILPITSEGKLILIKQYREAIDQTLIEIPAGLLEPDESPEACATRELQEEVGYKPGKLMSLGYIYPTPGFCNEKIHLFIATDLIESRLPCDENEEIEPFEVTYAEALNLISSGVIRDAKTIISILKTKKENEFPSN